MPSEKERNLDTKSQNQKVVEKTDIINKKGLRRTTQI